MGRGECRGAVHRSCGPQPGFFPTFIFCLVAYPPVSYTLGFLNVRPRSPRILSAESRLSVDDDVAKQSHRYRYTPLDLAKQQIRLITLKPGAAESTVECNLQIFDVDSAPPYIALSYTWGPPSPTAHILIEGKHFEIRENLHNFLLAYRNDDHNEYHIWIDQICISQGHTGERNHQVQMMSNIYSSCGMVIIWLGHEPRDLAMAFNKSGTALQKFECAKVLLRHKYFGRLWVVQEMLLPQRAHVFCGNVWVALEQLINAIHDRPRGSSLGLEKDSAAFHFNVVGYYQFFSYKEVLDLYYCIINFSNHKCEDPRDKIYGLLGLTPEEGRLVVDYTKRVQDVFIDVALIILRNGNWRLHLQHMAVPHVEIRSHMESSMLISSMGLHSSRSVISAFLADISRVLWVEKRQVPSAGFDTQLNRWWFVCDDTKYYRDGENCQEVQPGRYT